MGLDYNLAEYSGRYETLVQNYGHDLLIPVYFSFLLETAGFEIEPKYYVPAFSFIGCSVFEMAQGVGLYRGTFDATDFIAYAAGASLALGVSSLFTTNKNTTLEEKLV